MRRLLLAATLFALFASSAAAQDAGDADAGALDSNNTNFRVIDTQISVKPSCGCTSLRGAPP